MVGFPNHNHNQAGVRASAFLLPNVGNNAPRQGSHRARSLTCESLTGYTLQECSWRTIHHIKNVGG